MRAAILFFIFTLFCWSPVLCDISPRRRLMNAQHKMGTVSCIGADYSNVICADYLGEQGFSKLSEVQFPKIQLGATATALENMDELRKLSELAGLYMCCEISKVSIWDYKRLSFVYEEFCDANYAHFNHHKPIIQLARDNSIPIGHFEALASFCPARIVRQNPGADVATPWKKVRPAVETNPKVQNTKVVDGQCKKMEEAQILKGGSDVLTILLADEDVYYGSLKTFIGSVEELDEDKFMIWAADEPMYSLEIVRNIHGTPASLYPMQVGRAIQFKGVDAARVRQAWTEWTKNERYSLLNRSCVHSVVHLLRAALPYDQCNFNEELQFPFPVSTFDQLVQIGRQIGNGAELNGKMVGQIQDKIDDILEKKRQKDLASQNTQC